MTPKQEAFVREYLIDLNASAAYKRAGYAATGNAAEVNASRLLRNAQVVKTIKEAIEERSKRTEINSDYVLTTIRDTVERCRQAEPVMAKVDGEWVQTGEYQFDAQAVLKGCELLGKHLKLFTDKAEVSVKELEPFVLRKPLVNG